MAARGTGRMPCHRPGPARPLPGLPAGFPGQSRRAWVRSWLGRERASPDRDIGARGRRSRTRPGSAGGCSAGRPRGTGVINREGAGGAGARSPGRVAPRVRAWRVSPGLQSARRCGESGPRGRPTWVRLALAWPGPGGRRASGLSARDLRDGTSGPAAGTFALPPASSPAVPRWQQNPFSRRTTIRLLRTLAMGLVPPWPLRSKRCAAGCVRATAGFFSLPCEVRNRPPNAWRTSGPSRRAGGQTWPMSHAVGASCTGG